MTHGRRSTMPAKLIGLTAVVAGVVLGTREYREDAPVSELASDPVVVYPVDRNELSQLVLPLEAGGTPFQIPTKKRLTIDTISSNLSPAETGSKDNSTQLAKSAQMATLAHSAYELKLEDQQAWGSLQRQVDLVPKESQPADKTARVEIASSGLPIVPGIEDPHLWYGESSNGVLASSFSPASAILDASNNATVSINPIEHAEGSFDFSAPITTALLPPIVNMDTKSVLSEPVELAPVTKTADAKIGAPAGRTARAWETGRY